MLKKSDGLQFLPRAIPQMQPEETDRRRTLHRPAVRMEDPTVLHPLAKRGEFMFVENERDLMASG